jgi:hypothetical protein
MRNPRILTAHANPLKRVLTGLTVGLIGSGIGALAVVLLEPATGGFAWLLMGASAALCTLVLLAFARPTAQGHCARCGYDLAGVTIAAQGKCPECGLDQMAVA